MANKKPAPKKVQEEVEADIDPIEESLELEKEQKEVLSNDFVQAQEEADHIILTRENLILIGPGLFKYTHDEASLSACTSPTAFKGQMARNFGVRPGDAVICGSVEGGEGIVVYVPKDEE